MDSAFVLETTLRDGSYEIDFQFTPFDTAFLAAALDQAGFSYIEFAHGAGIGAEDAWEPQHRPPVRAAADDTAHLEAAHAVLGQAKLGVIMVVGPGYTPMSRLATLPRYGVKFVRLAYTPTTIGEETSLQYIEAAKNAGLITSINLMKTYAMTAVDVARAAAEAARRGADWFYVVDSAGGMTPASTREYVRAVRDASGLRVGLHAHNNSGLAVANSLAAVEAGATFVDSSLQGIGRATGNAPTEQLLLAMQRQGHEQRVNTDAVLRLGRLARGLFAERGNDPTNYASGSVQLHSRAIPALRALAQERRRSIFDLVLQVGRRAGDGGLLEREHFPEGLLSEALAAPAAAEITPAPGMLQIAERELRRMHEGGLAAVLDDLVARGFKRRKPTVLHLVQRKQYPYEGPLAWETADFVGASVAAGDGPLAKTADERHVDILCLDEGLDAAGLPAAKQQVVYPSVCALARSAVLVVQELRKPGDRVSLPGDNSPLAKAIAAAWAESGRSPDGNERAVLVREPRNLGGAEVETLRPGDVVILVGPVDRALVERIRARAAHALRPPLWLAVSAQLAMISAVRKRLARPLAPTQLTERTSTVDEWLVPGPGETAIVGQDPPTHVLEVGSPDAARDVALVRARLLLAGHGTL